MAKTKARKQFEKDYDKVYKRIQRYIERFSQIGWEIPKRLIPPVKEKATKKQYEKFKEIYIKDFRKELKKLQSDEVGKLLKGKEAKRVGKEREKQYIELQRESKRKQKQRKPKQSVQRIKTINNPIVTYPTFNVFESIRSRLLDFPSGKWVLGTNGKPMYYEFHTNTNILISILDDNISLDGYEKYLFSKEEQIMAEFDSIIYKESTQEQCDYSFVTLANELDYGRLYVDNTSTAEELSNMSDYYSIFGL